MWDFLKYADNTAVESNCKGINYRELAEYCKGFTEKYPFYKRYSRALTVILTDGSAGTVMTYAACIENRIPVLLTDSRLTKNSIKNILDKYRPSVVFDFKMKLFKEQFNILNYDTKYKIHDELALLLLTSGSTGDPRTVRISYENLYSNMKAISDSLNLRPDDRAALMLPASYSYGLSVINSNLYSGAALILCNGITDPGFSKYISQKKVTSLCGVPLTYRFFKKTGFEPKNIKTLRLITQAGGHLDVEIKKWLLKHTSEDTDIAIMYGQTEATARMTCFFLNKRPDKIESAGREIPGGKISISHSWIESVEKYDVKKYEGEIIYYGENVSMGYADGAEDLVRCDENNGRLETGDIGFKDKEGYIYLTGRKNRFAKTAGLRINLQDLEQKINEKFKIKTAVVSQGEMIFVFFEINDETSLINSDIGEGILSFLRDITGLSKYNFCIKETVCIPVNVNGKIDYALLSANIGNVMC